MVGFKSPARRAIFCRAHKAPPLPHPSGTSTLRHHVPFEFESVYNPEGSPMRLSILVIAALAMRLYAQAPPQSGVVSAGAGNPYARANQLPARILSFTAKPESIQPGQSATLQWIVENPNATAIE